MSATLLWPSANIGEILKSQGVLVVDGGPVVGEAWTHVMPLPIAEPVAGSTDDCGDPTTDIGFLVFARLFGGRAQTRSRWSRSVG